MTFNTSKKVLLIIGILALFSINTYAISSLPRIKESKLLEAKLTDPLDPNMMAFMISIAFIIKGIADLYEIPLTTNDNIVLAARNHMSKEDLKKHHLGNKIIIGIEIGLGVVYLLRAIGNSINSQVARSVNN